MEYCSVSKSRLVNPESGQQTWELDRAWILAAAAMGYTFYLVEQHFPEIEKAILSGDPSQLLLQLANEIRQPSVSSQYTRGDSTTATTQEILLLMELGYSGYKDEEGRLFLQPPSACHPFEAPANNSERLDYPKFLRSHSFHLFSRSAPPPPLETWLENFKRPGA